MEELKKNFVKHELQRMCKVINEDIELLNYYKDEDDNEYIQILYYYGGIELVEVTACSIGLIAIETIKKIW